MKKQPKIKITKNMNVICPRYSENVTLDNCYECDDIFSIDKLSMYINCKRGEKIDEFLRKTKNIRKR